MQLSDLTRTIAQLPPVAAARKQRCVVAHGLLRAARPAVVASLAEGRAEPFLVVTAHVSSDVALAEQLSQWSPRRVVLFPSIDALPYERVRLDRSVLAQRETVLNDLSSGEAAIVVASARALL